MSPKVRPAEWRPVGVDGLEPAAEEAVRSSGHRVVIAGPGAGKTELLAQRACYLLQTGLCPRPTRILAISFKRDAARNLRERVLQRCGSDLAQRFDSLTFDAFAKGLIDRFRNALPTAWMPTVDYRLDFKLSSFSVRDRLAEIPESEGGLSDRDLAGLNAQNMYIEDFIGRPLPSVLPPATTLRSRAAVALWSYSLLHGGQSALNFQMIGRLAELMLRANPKILRALRATYGFVFLDEFQDTTEIQYELTKTAFLGSQAVLTAVGDNKQRIMGWAGAMEDVFAEFRSDFGAGRISLVRNYRSAPELVRILGVLTAELDVDAAVPEAMDDGSTGRGECRVLLFQDHDAEARHIAALIAEWVNHEGVAPRDICILTRNRPADYTEAVRTALAEKHVEARIESELQDLLSEPVSTLVLHVLRLATTAKAPQSRTELLDFLTDSDGDDADRDTRWLERSLDSYIRTLRGTIASTPVTPESVAAIMGTIVTFLKPDRLGHFFPQYSQGTLLDDTLLALGKQITSYLHTKSWPTAIDALEGVGSVPIMTMHKSKGLEYHSVIFVGLEDSALWSFARNPAEETRGFFVAFSRAKKRVLFTFCRSRPRTPGAPSESQRRTAIGRLYQLLEHAGITPEQITA